MLIERAIVFIILGFFVFNPQVPSWHEGQHISGWYGYYAIGFLCLAIVAWTLRSNKKPPRR